MIALFIFCPSSLSIQLSPNFGAVWLCCLASSLDHLILPSARNPAKKIVRSQCPHCNAIHPSMCMNLRISKSINKRQSPEIFSPKIHTKFNFFHLPRCLFCPPHIIVPDYARAISRQ